MTQTDLHMTDIDLPNGAYHPSSEDFEAPRVNDEDAPKTVSEVEQLIRVALALGGRHEGLNLAEKAIQFQKRYEQENIFNDFVVERDHIDESNDVWLSQQMHSYADDRQAILNEEKKMYDRRMDWYDNDIPERLRNMVNRATSMLTDGVEFRTVMVVDENPGEGEVLQSELSGLDLAKFGYSTPVPVTICISSDSGKMYPFVPWCGTTVCVGPAKHRNDVSTLCKHEVAALLKYAQDRYDPDDSEGPEVPERFKRLMAPEAYNRFMENISP